MVPRASVYVFVFCVCLGGQGCARASIRVSLLNNVRIQCPVFRMDNSFS
jgi:hypothetical protein